MPLGVLLEPKAGRIDRACLADAGEHIGQGAARGAVIERIAGGHERGSGCTRDLGQRRDPRPVIAAIAVRGGEIEGTRKMAANGRDTGGQGLRREGVLGQQDEDEAVRMSVEVIERELARTLRRPPLAQRQKPREPAVRCPIGGIGEKARSVHEIEPAADEKAYPGRLRRGVRAHDPGQRVAVGERDGLTPQRLRLHDKLVRMRAAAEEGEVRGHLQFGIAGHGASLRRSHFDKLSTNGVLVSAR